MSWYSHWVERDLTRWQANGWVTDAGAASIRADLASRQAAIGAAGIFAILGAVLFGFAVMSFVAAHWSAMSKLARLTLILGTLWACYGGAAYLFSRKLDAFAQAAVLGGIAVYGAGIMLIAQMYHMEGNPPDAVLYWALGALLAAALLQSRPALAAAFVLLVVWSVWERALSDIPHWGFLPAWVAALALAAWLEWRPGLHLAALSLVVWLVPIGFLILDEHAHWLPALVGAAVALAGAAAGPAIDRHLPASRALFAYGLATAFAALFIAQFVDNFSFFDAQPRSTRRLLLLAVVTLAGLVAAMYWALHTNNRGALWIGYAAFAIEIYALYWETLGSLLNTSLFFLIAAILVSALAWVAYFLHQRRQTRGAAA
jgi:uncharacterized membrane protein